MNAEATSPRPVVVLLDEVAGSAALIDWSAALARALQRDLALVYVESASAMVAAALPGTLVLAHAGAPWVALEASDVERGFRAAAHRLRALAGTIGQRHAVNWSLRTVRGTLPHAALALFAEADLLFVGSSSSTALPARRRAPGHAARAARLATALDSSAAAARGLGLATRLAQVLSATLQVLQLAPGAGADEPMRLAGEQRADLLVLPRTLATLHSLTRAPCPALLVA